MKNKIFNSFLLISFAEGLGVIVSLILSAGGMRLTDISASRRILLIAVITIETLLLTLLLYTRSDPQVSKKMFSRLDRCLAGDNTLFLFIFSLSGLSIFFLGSWVFSYLFIPPPLRWVLFWGMLVALQCAAALVILQWDRVRTGMTSAWQNVTVPWKNADRVQKSTIRLLVVIGAVYFLVFMIPNALDAWDPHTFYLNGGDENITYPYVAWMLTPAETMEANVYHFFIYEDYHYGYPFYFLSMLAVLPSRILAGADFSKLTQINLLLLRQLISVLPMILSAFLLTCLQTQFRSKWKSVALFLAMLLLAGVVQYNRRFWHPDALVVLCVTLTIFFLNRDRFGYKHNFLLAAFFCGLASAIKLFGFFFVLSIGGYILYGLVKKIVTFKKAVIVSGAFLVVMFGTIVLSNPFLFVRDAREYMVEIMEEKSVEVREGYDEPDPEGVYQKGIAATVPHLQKPYAPALLLVFLLVSVAAAAVWGDNRLANGVLLGWVVAGAIYLTFFSAIKNYHYWLPTMVPLFSGFFGLADTGRSLLKSGRISARFSRAVPVVAGLTWLILVFQLVWSTVQAYPCWQELTRIGEIIR